MPFAHVSMRMSNIESSIGLYERYFGATVQGLDALVGRMGDEGVAVTDGPSTSKATGRRYAFVEDPDGELTESTEGK